MPKKTEGASPDLIDLVRVGLEAGGYGGLCDEDGCGCGLDDLMPCGSASGLCVAGYAHRYPDGGCPGGEWCDGGCAFHISTSRAEAAEGAGDGE